MCIRARAYLPGTNDAGARLRVRVARARERHLWKLRNIRGFFRERGELSSVFQKDASLDLHNTAVSAASSH